MPIAQCPECEADIHIDAEWVKGEDLYCDDCGAYLEVVGLDPVKLEVVEDELFDDDDDDDEDEY